MSSTSATGSASPTGSAVQNGSENRKSKSKFWIGLSFLLSAVILIWAFSLPFRQPGNSLISSEQRSGEQTLDLSERVKQRRTTADEFRDVAIALDQEFMKTLAKRNQPKRDLPGIERSKATWNRHEVNVKRQLDQLKRAKEGSLEASYRQELIESFEDGPSGQ